MITFADRSLTSSLDDARGGLNSLRRSRVATVLVGLSLFLTVPVSARAQVAGIGLQGAAGLFVPGGAAFEDRDNGFGFEGVVSWGFTGGLELGAGVHRSRHDVIGVVAPCDLTAAFAEVKWRLNTGTVRMLNIYPFIGARGGYVHRSRGGQDEENGDGLSAGGNAGIEFWISRRLALVGQGRIEWLSLDRIGPDDQPVAGAQRLDGSMAGVQIGLKIRP